MTSASRADQQRQYIGEQPARLRARSIGRAKRTANGACCQQPDRCALRLAPTAASRAPQAASPPLTRPAHPGRGGRFSPLVADANPHTPSPAGSVLAHSPHGSSAAAPSHYGAGFALAGHSLAQWPALAVASARPAAPANPQLMATIEAWQRSQSRPRIEPQPTRHARARSQPQKRAAGGADQIFALTGPCSPAGRLRAAQNCPADGNHHPADIRRTSPLRCALSGGACSRPLHPLAHSIPLPLPLYRPKIKAAAGHHPQLLFPLARCSVLRYHFSCECSSCCAVGHSRFCHISEAMSAAFLISKDSYPFWILVFNFVHSGLSCPSRLGLSSIHSQQHRAARFNSESENSHWLSLSHLFSIKKARPTDVLGPADSVIALS